jgi:hypothetical protein
MSDGVFATIAAKCKRWVDGSGKVEVRQVKAIVFGNWAAHPVQVADGSSDEKRWSITYRPAMLRIPCDALEPWRAVAIAEELSRDRNVAFADHEHPTRLESDACKAVIERWRAR